jgi:predicted XRE-type DNA-binding protein
MKSKEKIYRGGRNVFKDIAAEHPERLLARAQTMLHISKIIKKREWTQEKAAKFLSIPQSKISCLMNGKLSAFSLDYLFELLNALDRNVEIIIKPKTKKERIATTNVTLVSQG